MYLFTMHSLERQLIKEAISNEKLQPVGWIQNFTIIVSCNLSKNQSYLSNFMSLLKLFTLDLVNLGWLCVSITKDLKSLLPNE